MLRARRGSVREVERLLRYGVDPSGGDAGLLHRYFVDRDEAAFEAIIDRHGPLVLALCRRALREPADVDDAFQAVFLVLARRGGGLRDGRALSSWLYGVAHRVATRARADALKRRVREGDPYGLDEAVAKPAEPLDDSRELLDEELARLPDKYRVPLILCYLEGRSTEQAAAELGWPVGTVRSRMARAREVLRNRLSRRGVDASACLTVLRIDVASAVVPPSLATASAACLTAASTTAVILAQGVISTMTSFPWKLLGLCTASLGLTLGAIAAATSAGDGPGTVAQAEPQDQPAPPTSTTDAPAANSVDDRLKALEVKLDRLLEPGTATSSPTATPPDPIVGALSRHVNEPLAAPSPYDAKGLREIEAHLINAQIRYQTLRKLPEFREFPEKSLEAKIALEASLQQIIEPVRVLLARLREMGDENSREHDLAEQALLETNQYLQSMLDLKTEAAETHKLVVDDLEKDGRFTLAAAEKTMKTHRRKSPGVPIPAQFSELERANAENQRVENLVAEAKRKQKKTEHAFTATRRRADAIQKLIDWTHEHFEGAQLTIDK